MHRVVLALGANLGDPLGQVRAAMGLIVARLIDARVSAPYRSAALPSAKPQPDYVNAVVTGWSPASAREWLAIAKALELGAGRRPGEHWGPRVLDVDVIVCGASALVERDLVVPHPEATRRPFVLAPLAEIAPELVWPASTLTVAELLEGMDAPSPSRIEW